MKITHKLLEELVWAAEAQLDYWAFFEGDGNLTPEGEAVFDHFRSILFKHNREGEE